MGWGIRLGPGITVSQGMPGDKVGWGNEWPHEDLQPTQRKAGDQGDSVGHWDNSMGLGRAMLLTSSLCV